MKPIKPIKTPFYHLVPKDLHENLEFRKRMCQMGYESREAAEKIWTMCARDPLFYINTFVWTFDPRKSATTNLPFITYEFQDKALTEMLACIGKEDFVIEKSRDMGASWMCLVAFEYLWHFRPSQSFLLVSRMKDLVDKKNEPDCLFWKIDYILEHSPTWLIPDYERQQLTLSNSHNGSTITGASTTGNVARGGRKTAILLDEFAANEEDESMLKASRDATQSRIFNSTHMGAGTAFYQLTMKPTIRKFVLHWSIHPEKRKGLYRVPAGGKRTIIDEEWHEKNPGYEFRREPGRYQGLRSPWYDVQWDRAIHPQEIAQELDIDVLASDYQYFFPEIIEKHVQAHATPPMVEGDLDVSDMGEIEGFIENQGGRLRLWCPLTAERKPATDGHFSIGCDVATGTGASNSCASVLNLQTGEKVAEYANPHVKPHDFARMAVALARWFRGDSHSGAFLIWETNGPGVEFGDKVISMGYRNIYYQRDENSLSHRVTDRPGWKPTRDSKRILLGDYREALSQNRFVNHSTEALNECLSYVHTKGDSIEHVAAKTNMDPTGARSNHGDRVIADALANWALSNKPKAGSNRPLRFSDNSFMARRRERESAIRRRRAAA